MGQPWGAIGGKKGMGRARDNWRGEGKGKARRPKWERGRLTDKNLQCRGLGCSANVQLFHFPDRFCNVNIWVGRVKVKM